MERNRFTKYFHISNDYAFIFGKWQEVLDDSVDIRNNDVMLYQLYSGWARELYKNNEFEEALEKTKRATNIVKRKAKLQLPTKLKKEGFGYNTTIKQEIDILIKLKKYDEARIKIDEYYSKGYISVLKKIDFEFEVLLEQQNYEQALENREEYQKVLTSLDYIKLEDQENGDENIDNSFNEIMSSNMMKISSVFGLMGDTQKRLEFLINKFNFDKKNNIGEYHLGWTASQIGEIWHNDGKMDEAIRYYELAIGYNDKIGKPNRYNYNQIAHSYNKKGHQIEDNIGKYKYYKLALEYFQKYDFMLDEAEINNESTDRRFVLKWKLATLALNISSEQKKDEVKWLIEAALNISKIDRNNLKIYQRRKEYELWIKIAENTIQDGRGEKSISPSLAYWKANRAAFGIYDNEYKKHDINIAIKCIKCSLDIYSSSENLLTDEEKIIVKEIDNEFKKYISAEEFEDEIFLILNRYLRIIYLMSNKVRITDDYEQLIKNFKYLVTDNGLNLDEELIERIHNVRNISDIILNTEFVDDLINQ